METLYVFIDESGDFTFSDKGTKHLVLCAYSTSKPHQHSQALQELKYKCLADGLEQECFHATEDMQYVRNEVYSIIKASKDAIYDIVYLEKNKAHPIKQNKKDMYSLLVGALLTYIFGRLDKYEHDFGQIIVVLDKLFTNKDQGILTQVIKSKLKEIGRPYRLYFFQTKSDANGQIADYGAWGKFVSLERNEMRPMEEIKHLVANDFDLFRRGTTRYY